MFLSVTYSQLNHIKTVIEFLAAIKQDDRRQRRQGSRRAPGPERLPERGGNKKQPQPADTPYSKLKLLKGNRLPDGRKCSEGFCSYGHDKLKPGQPGWRNPSWDGPLLAHIDHDIDNDPKAKGNIERERATIAAERKITAVQLKPAAGGSGDKPVSLVDLLSSSGFTTPELPCESGMF